MTILAGKTALVTGASSGIGRAAAVALAEAGAQVALVARRGDRLADLASQIEAGGGKALVRAADVTRSRTLPRQSRTRSVTSAASTSWSTRPA